jgi:hypothetical protein
MAGYTEKYLIEPSGETARKLATAKDKAKRLAMRIGSATVADFRGKVLVRYTRKARNAGYGSRRKHKKFMKSQGFSGSDIQYVKSLKMDKSGEYLPKRGKNPRQLLFRTKASALKYAREHGAKKFSIIKLKAGR